MTARLWYWAGALGLIVAVALQAQELPELLSAAVAKGGERPVTDARVLRSRFVELNRNAVLGDPRDRRRVVLNLFEDARWVAEQTKAYWSLDGSTYLWHGRIEGMQRGWVVLGITGEVAFALINTDQGEEYRIQWVQGTLHAIQQVDIEAPFATHDALQVPLAELEPVKDGDKNALVVEQAAGETVIDILVAYTPAARDAAGGVAAIENKIQTTVAATNQAFANSGVLIQLNLVHTMLVNYNEGGSGVTAALAPLRAANDGVMDEVHAARNAYGADLVCLWIHGSAGGPSGGIVGYAYQMLTPSATFASWAFSVVEQYWAPSYTMAHEIGHNMGANHDRDNADGPGAYPYSYGYQHRVPGSAFRTIMAYQCSTMNCPKIPYWSNPAVSYNGAPTGIPSNQPNSANNAQTLNNTRSVVAAFRATSGGCSYQISPQSTTVSSSAGSGSISVTAPAGCAWTASTATSWLQLTSGTSGSGNGTVTYSYTQNSTPSSRSGAITVAGFNFSITQNAAAPTNVTITVTTQPAGLNVRIDGTVYSTPQTFSWQAGSTHTLAALTPQGSANTRYIFSSWSQGGEASQTITTPSQTTTYTANYVTQFALATAVSPAGSGVVTVTPPSADGFYAAGASLELAAQPAANFSFTGWSGDLSGTANPATITMSGPRSVLAQFAQASACSYSLSRSEANVSASGDVVNLAVQTGPECSWTVSSSVSWAQFPSTAPRLGSGPVQMTIGPNLTAVPRAATVQIAGVTFRITQAAAGCSFQLTGPGGVLPASGGSYAISVATAPGCSWTAMKSASWMTFAGASAGTSSGSLSFTASPNFSSTPRTATITIGGVTLHFVQKGQNTPQIFTDVAPSNPFFDYITLLGLNNVADWCLSGAYCPDATITRSSMAIFLVRSLVGDSFSFPQTPFFQDVPPTHPQFAYIQKLRELGITNGCGNGNYCPSEPVTRGQMAAFVVRARLGITFSQSFPYPEGQPFADVDSSNIFFSHIQKLRELGITTGCTPTAFCPNDLNTRGQMAAFVARGFF
ncbi:MAG: S-layer homology domain-containing protein [Bryobacteraceae bacterium]|nr:S-layer homology domain-containing protein [Bryobacteraceae bacterium]MDW8379369.1 S-layer homology domain-containing protein [Bryobacterales bacterium]